MAEDSGVERLMEAVNRDEAKRLSIQECLSIADGCQQMTIIHTSDDDARQRAKQTQKLLRRISEELKELLEP